MSDTDARRPERIQRKRTKGWRMPEGAVYVGRPTPWGNPFAVQCASVIGRPWFDIKERPLRQGIRIPAVASIYTSHSRQADAVAQSVYLFRELCVVLRRDRPASCGVWLDPLRGHDLACWCALDAPCHADVLLELSNEAAWAGVNP